MDGWFDDRPEGVMTPKYDARTFTLNVLLPTSHVTYRDKEEEMARIQIQFALKFIDRVDRYRGDASQCLHGWEGGVKNHS